MRGFPKRLSLLAGILVSGQAMAQQTNEVVTEIELGAIFTSGNTEEQNVKYGIAVDWLRENWEYQFTSDGLRNSRDGEVTAQKYYHVARGRRELSETSYFAIRGAYEDDRFSGYHYHADSTASYGRTWLNNIDNMSLDTDIGPGYRISESEEEDLNELIVRVGAEYEWGISDTANFYQNLALEFGQDSNIYRSETGIESAVMDNLSLRLSFNVKHQTEVPIGRENTDTETAITLVWSF